jgi:hypothetical protein
MTAENGPPVPCTDNVACRKSMPQISSGITSKCQEAFARVMTDRAN